ncbi:MAG: Ig-like domain-containing protein [Pseudoruminococcus massiliensis]|uniref:Ig-like domain-containing protein n=1 Tax=Pseudoruminococcus massiliensis TaxID=2086583 RepID=UPI0039945D1F|nr:Ig-like domain-containing protein [Oscillospiraceae bacterium]
MSFIQLSRKRILAIVIAFSILIISIIVPPYVSAANNVPSNMLNNVFLNALEYTGYDVQRQISNGTIYRNYGSSGTPNSVTSNIPYSLSAIASGLETTNSGKPNIRHFENYGLCCGSYVSYVYYNYLPNVAKISTSNLAQPYSKCSVESWETAIRKWIDNGTGKNIGFTQNSNGSLKTSSDIPIGSVVIFKSSGYRYAHVAVYAGYYNGKHFITHCGGDEGPCIQAIDSLYLYAGQSVKLIVAPNLYNNVKLNKSSLTLGKGESYTIKANGNATWSSSNTNILTVSNGKITAKNTGTAMVVAKGLNGSKANCMVTVRNAPNSISLNKTNLTLGIGETYDLDSRLPKNTASFSVKYSSDNSSTASVVSAGGLVTAKKEGTATITATTYNGKKVNCTVTVKKAPKTMSLNKTKITLGVGETYDLDSYLPSGTAAHSIKYTSNNSNLVSVVSAGGLVTAKKEGVTNITAIAYNGVKVQCTVTVKKEPKKLSLNNTELELNIGEKFDLDSSVPNGTAAYHVYYSSNNSDTANVAKYGGLVTAMKKGKAKITAEAYNGVKITCHVNVVDDIDSEIE